MLRSRGEFAEPHGAQLPAERLPAHGHPELIPQPLRQIDQPPAHDPVEIGLRAGFDRRDQGRALLLVQERPLPGCLPVGKAPRTVSVEAQNPVADRLQIDPADPGRMGPQRPLIDRCKSQEPPGLARITARLRKPSQFIRRIVSSKHDRCRHEEPPSVLHGESQSAALGNPPRESASSSAGISHRFAVRIAPEGVPLLLSVV